MLKKYQNHDLIGEILVINNRQVTGLENLTVLSKVRVLNNGRNLFVNPAWNLGVKEAKEEKVIIANDDITIPKFDKVMEVVSDNLFRGRVLGFHEDCFSDKKQKKIEVTKLPKNDRAHGFGVFMVMFQINANLSLSN